MIERLLGSAENTKPPSVEGRWFNVRYRPNLNTGEIFNIGVGFVTAEGKYFCRALDNFKGFTCIYGPEMEGHVRFLVGVVTSALRLGKERPPSDNIIYSESKFASGSSVEAILAELYSATVTMASVHEDKDKDVNLAFATADNDHVRKRVFDVIRQKAQLQADSIIAQDSRFMVSQGDEKYLLDIPLQGSNRLGSVVSALYSSRATVEIHLLRATLDLETARRIRVNDEVGLFALRPNFKESIIPESTLTQIDNVIDAVDWKLRRQKIRFDVHDDPIKLADQIMGWANIKAG